MAFTPDGKRALVAKFPGHKIGVLDVDGQKVTYTKYNMNVGLWPYNVDVTPDGASPSRPTTASPAAPTATSTPSA